MAPETVSRSSPPPQSEPADNPIVAVGRKVKSVLGTQQQPSVRIVREPAKRRGLPVPKGVADKLAPHLSQHGKSHTPENRAELAEHYAAHAESHRSGEGKEKENKKEQETEGRMSRVRTSIQSLFGAKGNDTEEQLQHEYDADTVDLLDVVDPEVSTLSTLTNVQNSLFVPNVGRFVNRRPAYRLSERPEEERVIDKLKASLKRVISPAEGEDEQQRPGLGRADTITSVLQDSHYAVLPHGEKLEGWSRNEKDELDDLVRHMLHSRRARFKRSLKGFSKYVRRPLGLFVTVYATLITLFGAAWVLFLIGWISLGARRDYIIHVVDLVLVALFAVIGDGLAPFRAVDTYHMIYIAYFHRKTWKKRKKMGLPELVDQNDLPEQRKEDVQPKDVDLESLVARRIPRRFARAVTPHIPKSLARHIITRSKGLEDPSYEYTVLSPEEQATLEHHERKFSKSHTFYKPHETETHYAFPLNLLVAVVLLLDLHSCLQITLGACTWGISYKTRPFALTTVILCCSITCNIMGGVLISIGDKRTRKREVIERMYRQELTSEAIEQLETKWMKEAEQQGHLDPAVRKKQEEEKEQKEVEELKKSWKYVPNLPKHLLGKGEDHRQPSLPQWARRSGSNVGSSSSSSSSRVSSSSSSKSKGKSGRWRSESGGKVLDPVQEDSSQQGQTQSGPSRSELAALRRGGKQEDPKAGVGTKILKTARRADLDRS